MNHKDIVFEIVEKADKGLEDIIVKFKWEEYTLDVKGKGISFADPDEEQLNEFLDLLEENGYPDKEKTGTAADAANVQLAGRSDRLDAYRAWLQSHTGEQDRQLRDFVREAHKRRKGSLNGSGQAAVEDTKTSSGLWRALVPSFHS